jgi:hypothetical protein
MFIHQLNGSILLVPLEVKVNMVPLVHCSISGVYDSIQHIKGVPHFMLREWKGTMGKTNELMG